jgi:hypothetical protein
MTNYFDRALPHRPVLLPGRKVRPIQQQWLIEYHNCRQPIAANLWGRWAARTNDHASSEVGRVCWLIALNPLGAASAAKGRSIRER